MKINETGFVKLVLTNAILTVLHRFKTSNF
jgi:hypothetical protein